MISGLFVNMVCAWPVDFRRGMPCNEIAALAHEVTTAAVMGDPVAITICQSAAKQLAEGLLVCANRTGLLGTPFTTVLSGGLFQAGSVIVDPLTKAIGVVAPEARLVEAEYAPVYGGVLLALSAIGIPWSADIVANLPSRR